MAKSTWSIPGTCKKVFLLFGHSEIDFERLVDTQEGLNKKLLIFLVLERGWNQVSKDLIGALSWLRNWAMDFKLQTKPWEAGYRKQNLRRETASDSMYLLPQKKHRAGRLKFACNHVKQQVWYWTIMQFTNEFGFRLTVMVGLVYLDALCQ